MSIEQKRFLRSLKIEKIIIFLIQVLIVSGFLILWELASQKGYINSFIYSSPSRMVSTLVKLVQSHNLFNHIFCTIKEIVISFSLGSSLGLILAVLLYEFKLFAKIVEPFLITLNSLPKVALGPMIIIVAGANIKSIILMALLINLIVTILSIYNGFVNVDNTKLTLMKSFKATKIQILKYLLFPESINTIISSLKINISMTLIGVIMGEFLVSKEGVGYLIIYGTQIFDMNLVMTGIFVLIILSLTIYILVSKLIKYYEN